MRYPKPFELLIKDFSQLPSIGPKMAERLVLHLFKQETREVVNFSEHLKNLTDLGSCKECHHITENELCTFCQDTKRDQTLLCVVEDPLDVIAIERIGRYNGLYHVLGGTLETANTDTNGTNLTVSSLLRRIERGSFSELIIATNPTSEGDLTALYLKRKLINFSGTVSRLARGLSTGSDIEYADEETLTSALTSRIKII